MPSHAKSWNGCGGSKVMEKILVLSHVEADGTLGKTSLEALPAAVGVAKSCGGSLHVGLFGWKSEMAAQQIASCGAAKILAIDVEDLALPRYGSDLCACEALSRQSGATLILAPHTSRM